MDIMLLLGKYLLAAASLAGITVVNVFLFISNMNNRKAQRAQTDEINNFTSAVEKVDDMDDDAVIATLGGMRSKASTMYNGDKNADDK